MQPTKFKMEKPTPEPKKDRKGFSISLSTVLLFVMSVGLIAYGTFKGVTVYQDWKASWDVVSFAKQNPEFVRQMKVTYETEVATVKEQMLVGIIQASEPTPSPTATPTAEPSKIKSVK